MSEKVCASDDDDDDEPLLSSPNSSSDENEVQNDVFHYTARKFQKVNHCTSTGPSPARRRRHHVDAIQTKLSALGHQQQARDRKLRNCLKIDLDDSSDDDDDDVAVLANNNTATLSRAQAAKESTAKNPPPPRAATSITIDISDDSDDEVNASRFSLSALKQAPREVLEVLQKSRQATNRLQRAQLYHAEDVEVKVDTIVNISSGTNSPSNANITVPSRPNWKQAEMNPRLESSVTNPIKPTLGKKIQLTCRCQVKLNGNNQPTLEKNLTVHEHQALSVLMDKVLTAFSLPSTARVALFFDGLLLDTKRTAASYEMEDSDLVDINASVIAMPPTNAAVASSGPGVGPRLSLTLRCKVDSKVHETSLQLGKNEVFKTLLDQYIRQQNISGKCVLHFDGEALGLDRTPSNYDMEDGDLIDVVR